MYCMHSFFSVMTYGLPTGSVAAPTAAGRAIVKGRVAAWGVRRPAAQAGPGRSDGALAPGVSHPSFSFSRGGGGAIDWVVEDDFEALDTSYGPVNFVFA
jgi:hypothetical protein